MGLNEWTLESRTRYALVWGGINILVVIGLLVLFGSFSVGALWLLIPLAILSLLAQAYIWYPRTKAKIAAQDDATRRSPV